LGAEKYLFSSENDLGLLRYIWETKILGMILIIHMTLLALYGLVMGV